MYQYTRRLAATKWMHRNNTNNYTGHIYTNQQQELIVVQTADVPEENADNAADEAMERYRKRTSDDVDSDS